MKMLVCVNTINSKHDASDGRTKAWRHALDIDDNLACPAVHVTCQFAMQRQPPLTTPPLTCPPSCFAPSLLPLLSSPLLSSLLLSPLPSSPHTDLRVPQRGSSRPLRARKRERRGLNRGKIVLRGGTRPETPRCVLGPPRRLL